MKITHLLIILAGTLIVQPGRAHEPVPHYDHISLSASASREVSQDQLHLTLFALDEAEDARSSAEAVSTRINRALEVLNKQSGMTVQTGSFRTYPVYHKQSITGWRSRQTLDIKTASTANLSQLLARLQQYVQMENVRYLVSEETRQSVENELIQAAIMNFEQRAQLATSSLGRKKYRIIDLNISTHGMHPPQPMLARSLASAAEADSAPAIQAGTQLVQVSVEGKIEIQLN
jgi:predicted secreted protein